MKQAARAQIAFYGATKNYAFQFDMLGFEGVSAKLNDRLKKDDTAGMAALISDEMFEHYAVTASWSELGPKLLQRYKGRAARVLLYQAEESMRRDPSSVQNGRPSRLPCERAEHSRQRGSFGGWPCIEREPAKCARRST